MILVSRNTLYAGTKRKIFEFFGDYSICRSRYMPVTDCTQLFGDPVTYFTESVNFGLACGAFQSTSKV